MAVRQTLSVSHEKISAVAVSLDGTKVGAVASDGTLSVREFSTGIEKARFHQSEGYCDVLAFSGDGTMLVGSYPSSDLIELWDLRTQKRLALLKGHFAPVSALIMFPDQRTLATASMDATVRLWNIVDGRLIETLTGDLNAFWCLALSPDGRRLAAGGSGGIIKLWDTVTKQEVATLRGTNNATVWRLAFSSDGKSLGSIIGGMIRMWRAESIDQIDAKEQAKAKSVRP
jgi:WD40 repeat protein